jgi:preprotein translocase subunit SecD
MIMNRHAIQNSFYTCLIIFMMILFISSATLRASDLSGSYKDGVSFELRLASMEKVEGWKSVTTPWKQSVWISPAISLSNTDVAQASAEQRGAKYSVNLWFTEEGTLKLARLTKANIGKYVAIMVNERAVSVPKIMDEISGGRAMIEGNFTEEEARLLADGIMAK